MTLSLVCTPPPEHLPVRGLLSPVHASFAPDATVSDTVARIRELSRATFVTYCWVVGPGEELLGVVSMRELLLAEPQQRLEELMTRDPFAIDADASVLEAMSLVLPHHFPIYPVVDRAHRLVGVLRGSRLFQEVPVTLVSPSDEEADDPPTSPGTAVYAFRGGLITHDRTIPGQIDLDREAIQFTAPQRQPTRLLLRSVRRVRHAPGVPGVGICTGVGELRLALAPEEASRLTDALLVRCPGIDRSPPAAEPTLPVVSGRAEVCLDDAPAVAGTLSLDATRLVFDSKRTGQAPEPARVGPGLVAAPPEPDWSVPVSAIIAVERIDQSRVRIATHRETIVARGEGAQRVWVGLLVLRESRLGADGVVPRFYEQDPEHPAGGWFWGLARRSFGGVGATRFLGTTRWFWHAFPALHELRVAHDALELHVGGETLVFTGAGAEQFGRALPEAWLAALPSLDIDAGWAVRAVLRRDGHHQFGVLSVTTEGIVFTFEGSDRVIAPRGAALLPVVDPHQRHVLGIETRGVRTLLLVADPAEAVSALRKIATTPSWETPGATATPVELAAEQLGVLSGPASYVSLLRDGEVVATTRDITLDPDAGRVRIGLGLLASAPPVPFLAVLEVGGVRGRYMVPGAVVGLVHDRARAGHCDVTFRFGGAPAPRNRREYFRLPVREPVTLSRVHGPRAELLEGNDTLMVNLSQRGCRLRTPWHLDGGERCRIELPLGDRHLVLEAEVVYAMRTDGSAWEVAAIWLAQSAHDGAALYHDRELASLRRRRWPG